MSLRVNPVLTRMAEILVEQDADLGDERDVFANLQLHYGPQAIWDLMGPAIELARFEKQRAAHPRELINS